MDRKITFKGNPMTLVGRVLKEGDRAPDFRVSSQDMKEVTLSDFEGKVKIITFFLSIDTPVCDLQVKEFNKRATGISSKVVILGISKDLPFAQRRFCETFDIENVIVLSDYKYSSFGINYGLLIKELNLLARGIAILDKNDTLRYMRIVEEATRPPDYDNALKALEAVVAYPALPEAKGDLPSKCIPCETGTPPLPKEKIDELIEERKGWELIEGKKIIKEFRFRDFQETKYFLDVLSVIAEEQGHHPAMTLIYNKLKVTLTTHASGGLTKNDFIMAKIFDGAYGV